MKKFIIVLTLVITMLFVTGCSIDSSEVKDESDVSDSSMFVLIETGPTWRVVYHKDTKIMYVVSYGHYNCGNFTVLVTEDGMPMLYEEE